jgi:hypothetical protein
VTTCTGCKRPITLNGIVTVCQSCFTRNYQPMESKAECVREVTGDRRQGWMIEQDIEDLRDQVKP